MIENAPSSVISAKIRGEITCTPEKASAFTCWQSRTSSVAPSLPARLPQSRSVSSNSKYRDVSRSCTASVAKACTLLWNSTMRPRSIVLITSTLCRMNGLVASRRIFQKKPGSLLQSAASIEQFVFSRNFDAHPEVIIPPSDTRPPCRQSDAHSQSLRALQTSRSRDSVISSSVRPPTSTSAFGRSFVSGRSRVPSPAARIMLSSPFSLRHPGLLPPSSRSSPISRCSPALNSPTSIPSAQPLRHLLRQKYRAMLSARTAERHHQMLEATARLLFTLASTSDITLARNWCTLSC